MLPAQLLKFSCTQFGFILTKATQKLKSWYADLRAADWQPSTLIREHYFTDGRKMAGEIPGRRCFVDYLLHKDNRYLALVEAKKESEHLAPGGIPKHIYTKEKLVSGLLDEIEDLLAEK